MISPVAEGNVGDVESLGKVWVTRESAHHGVVGVCPQLEHVLAHQRTGGGAGGQQELAGQGPGGQSSQSSEVETSGGSLLLTTARGEELLAGVAVELLGRAGHHGRPNSQVQLGGGGGRQTLRSKPAGTSRLEDLERQSFFFNFKFLQHRHF